MPKRIPEDASHEIQRECATHGMTMFRLYKRTEKSACKRGYRCLLCNAENKARHRKSVRQILIEEHGGCCEICGYNRYAGALHFHHLEDKEFEVSKLSAGIERARKEAKKCILLCANCHAEQHADMM